MPLNQVPATVDHESIQAKFEAGKGKLSVDVASYGGLVPFNLNGGIQELDQDGVVAYKCFVATCGDRSIDGDFMNVDDYSLYEGMKQIAKTGKILSIHAENAAITDALGQQAYENGEQLWQLMLTHVLYLQKLSQFVKLFYSRKKQVVAYTLYMLLVKKVWKK